MPTPHFYLKNPTDPKLKDDLKIPRLIYLQMKLGSNPKKLVFAFNQFVPKKDWNQGKERVKSNTATTDDGKYLLNDLLTNLERECLSAYNKEIKNGMPTREMLKRHLQAFMDQNKEVENEHTLFKLIDRFIANEFKRRGKSKSVNTIKQYRASKKHLLNFQNATRYRVDFDTISIDFFYKYLNFLTSGKYTDEKGKQCQNCCDKNTLDKYIGHIKEFMNQAVLLKYTTNTEYKHPDFFVGRQESDSVYLSDDEIEKLYKIDLSAENSLEYVRDLFVFGCLTGLRFSDYSNIQRNNIITVDRELYIKLITQKGSTPVIVPCHQIVLDIFEKYQRNENSLPVLAGNTQDSRNALFNRKVKDVCKMAGFTETGRLTSEPQKELWECVTSHTARRSFATNLYLQGFPTYDIMKITTHTSEKNFLKYIKVGKLQAAKRLSQHIRVTWQEKLNRAALATEVSFN